jgi:hypothetical protein
MALYLEERWEVIDTKSGERMGNLHRDRRASMGQLMTDDRIHDLSRGALAELLGLPADEERSHWSLLCDVMAGYHNGSISLHQLIDAWNEEQEEF